MSLNHILNHEHEEPFDSNDNVFTEVDPELIDLSEFALDFDIVNAGAYLSGYGQSQTGPDAAVPAMLDNSLYDMQNGVQNWAAGACESELPPSNLQSQTTTDSSSGESPGVLSQPESQDRSPPSSLEDALLDDQQVCYGMIHHVDVKLTGDMPKLTINLNQCREISKSSVQRFKLQAKSDHILLLLPDGTNFGYPRDHITKVLTSLLRREGLDFEAVAGYRNLYKKISKANKAGDAIVQVDINIYGPLQKAQEVGGILSKAKAWLQRPDFHKKNVSYENPHVIKFHDINELTEPEVNRNEPSATVGDPLPDIDQVIREIDASTHRAAGLERATADIRLRTELLEHQETALTFMLQRESGDIPSEFRLWKPKTVDGREIFVHQITKYQSSLLPEESGGGILADEMGMGKSLSILSLLLKTTEEGQKWAEDKKSEDLAHSDIETYAPSTLIIVPSALLINNWVKEIEMHLGNALQVTKYHGERRDRDTAALAKAEIVLTTYKTLATDFASKKHTTSPLHSVGWFRIVLDEAHNIRRPATTYHKACAALTARSRWCLSGTPIQNRLEDIGALFTFLKVDQCSSMACFRWYLVYPYEQRDPVAIERLVMLYDSVVLRRTKDVLVLPGQENRDRKLDLSPQERLQYETTEKILNRSIRQFRGEHEEATQFGLFQAHLQLRIFCNHGTHQKLFSWKKKNHRMTEEAFLIEAGLNFEKVCDGCRQPEPTLLSTRVRNIFKEKCSHAFCQECLDVIIDSQRSVPDLEKHCPICDLGGKPRKRRRTGLSVHETEDVTMEDVDDDGGREKDDGYFDPAGYSTKMTALVKDVKETLNETVMQENNRTQKAKSIIFSCWTRTLNLIELYLNREKIEFLRVDGEMLMSKRQRILDRFSEPGGPQIMLMTTGTGAFGLNLTAANRIFIVELQWNPSVEYQAIARAIRLRQKDKVIVTRYLMNGTVEQEMRNQQRNKERAAKAGFEKRDRMDVSL